MSYTRKLAMSDDDRILTVDTSNTDNAPNRSSAQQNMVIDGPEKHTYRLLGAV